ncbi:serine hydrolase domain-containing protein [Nitrincola alkalilacustris]|uniref:serine hydrolase domain-containing protein n=1 Tax=Nitrincola alkalilacustris TaxID=1571224 RepID=UPI00124C8380|nr:serine hydrolase [Nitrincola alkalilacustris]
MKALKILLKVIAGFMALILVIGLGAFVWLKQSPYWAGITLFSDAYRVENFRSMDRIFPHRTVASSGDVRVLQKQLMSLPKTYIFQGADRDTDRFLEQTTTTGLLVLHRDTIVYEQYWLGADENALLTSWSMAKSVLSALIGIAIDEGYIGSVHDTIGDYVPTLKGTDYGAVSIDAALTMSSGMQFDENYENPLSDINMLFIRAMAMNVPVEQILAELVAVREPGIYNDYISSDSMALGLVLEYATGMPLSDYLATRLWAPMGAEANATWSSDRTGREFALCCLNATLRDFGRFGLLYLEGGQREGEAIIPADWVQISLNPTAPHLQPGENPDSSWTFGYGYKWWVPEEPQGDFLAIGVWGQYIYVHPEHEVVIVKTSADPNFDANDHESVAFFRAIAGVID